MPMLPWARPESNRFDQCIPACIRMSPLQNDHGVVAAPCSTIVLSSSQRPALLVLKRTPNH
jgi:hypothetical protein